MTTTTIYADLDFFTVRSFAHDDPGPAMGIWGTHGGAGAPHVHALTLSAEDIGAGAPYIGWAGTSNGLDDPTWDSGNHKIYTDDVAHSGRHDANAYETFMQFDLSGLVGQIIDTAKLVTYLVTRVVTGGDFTAQAYVVGSSGFPAPHYPALAAAWQDPTELAALLADANNDIGNGGYAINAGVPNGTSLDWGNSTNLMYWMRRSWWQSITVCLSAMPADELINGLSYFTTRIPHDPNASTDPKLVITHHTPTTDAERLEVIPDHYLGVYGSMMVGAP